MRLVEYFGPFSLDTASGELWKEGVPIELPPKATQILITLIESRGRLVAHSALFKAGWDDTVVEYDQALYTCIRQIRSALDDDARNPTYIETVPRRGYRFCYLESPTLRVHPHTFIKVLSAAAVVIVVVMSGILVDQKPLRRGIDTSPVVVDEFRIDGFPVSVGGIDSRLEASVRSGLSMSSISKGAEASYKITGRVLPTPDGARFETNLIRLSDQTTIWSGQFNPYCPEFKGDPVSYIGRLVAGTVATQINS